MHTRRFPQTMCVSRDQFKALVEGSILGASTPANENGDEAAAGTPIAESVAPAALPAPEANHDTGVASSTSATPDVQQGSEDVVENPEPVTDAIVAPEPEAMLARHVSCEHMGILVVAFCRLLLTGPLG